MSCDVERIVQDLEEARRLNARVGINGDVFDLITPQDRKRFRLSAVPSRLYEAGDNMIGAAVDWACEILGPYVDLIDFIGCGNHDDSAAKYHGQDVISQLIGALNREYKTRIEYGGYCGWWTHKFAYHGIRSGYKIQYHHGAGGSSPVSKGMIGFQRASAWVDGADLLWRGHKHHKTVDRNVVQTCDDYGKIRHKDRLFVMSASYLFTYYQQSSDDALAKGRRANYAADWDVAPQAHGGVFLTLTCDGREGLVASARV